MMRVAYVSADPGVPVYGRKGASIHVQEIIRALLARGIDVDLLCQGSPVEIQAEVCARGRRFREKGRGYALGSGNSIPDYVPVEGYLAMIAGAEQIRAGEGLC